MGVQGSNREHVGYCSILLGTVGFYWLLECTKVTGGIARYCGVLRNTIGYWEYWGGNKGYWWVPWGIMGSGGFSGVAGSVDL